ncbi:MAG: hypothetical protein ABGX25_06675 [Nautiliaceae bacterium]
MNKIKAYLQKIYSLKHLNLLEFKIENYILNVVVLEMNIDLKIGDEVFLGIKPTKLFISSKICNFENVLPVKIKNIQKGEILSNILCEVSSQQIEVIMLSKNVNFEKEGYLFFKSTDVYIIGKVK